MAVKRVFLIVLDSFGVGALPDAADFGDGECHTAQTVLASRACTVPYLTNLGLCNIEGVAEVKPQGTPWGAYGRCAERSRGKDTTTGHWEISGVISKQAMPTFPDGFPPELMRALAGAFGRPVICGLPYSGTQVIRDYGREHLETGALIVYTSADSVLQIAAHESLYPREELYDFCLKARELCRGKWGVGRIIARPFTGTWPDYVRTSGRHDYSLEPAGETILDALTAAELDTIGVGKIRDIFAGRGVQRHIPMDGNADGMLKTIGLLAEDFHGLAFTNLVDFDMVYGHRRDVRGYAEALSLFDSQLGAFLAGMRPEDVLMITADHGCDPGAAGTDHTREYIPLLVYGKAVRGGVDLGTRASFADIAATVAELLGVPLKTEGKGFAQEILL